MIQRKWFYHLILGYFLIQPFSDIRGGQHRLLAFIIFILLLKKINVFLVYFIYIYIFYAHFFQILFTPVSTDTIEYFMMTHKNAHGQRIEQTESVLNYYGISPIQIIHGVEFSTMMDKNISTIAHLLNVDIVDHPILDDDRRSALLYLSFHEALLIARLRTRKDWIVIFEDDVYPIYFSNWWLRKYITSVQNKAYKFHFLSSIGGNPILWNLFHMPFFGLQASLIRTENIDEFIEDTIFGNDNFMNAANVIVFNRTFGISIEKQLYFPPFPDLIISRMCFQTKVLKCSAFALFGENEFLPKPTN